MAGVFLLILFLGAQLAAAEPPALALPVLSSEQIFSNNSAGIYRLITKLPDASSPQSSGTAFAVHQKGYLVSNYHVVSEAVIAPETYQLFVEMPEGPVLATIESIDVVNDLALIRVARDLPRSLEIAADFTVAPGEQIFSMGFPLSTEKLFLAQGNFGGFKVMGLVPAMLASVALNSGMSGGPTLDRSGRVIAVNRAIAARAQGISYFSPLAALHALISNSSAGRSPAEKFEWKKEIVTQVVDQEKKSLGDMKRFSQHKRERVGRFSFIIPLTDLACGQDKSSKQSSAELFRCETQSLAYLGPGQSALRVVTAASEDSSAGGQNNFKELDKNFQNASSASRSGGGRKVSSASTASPEACGLRRVKNKSGSILIVRFCSVMMKEFPGLFSTFVKVETEEDGFGKPLNLSQFYQGVSLSTTATLLEEFLDSVQRVKK